MKVDYRIVYGMAIKHCSLMTLQHQTEQQFQAVHVGRCQITHQHVKDVHFISYGYQNLFVDILLIDEISFTHPKYEVYLNASLSYGKDS